MLALTGAANYITAAKQLLNLLEKLNIPHTTILSHKNPLTQTKMTKVSVQV